jgi:hypothetical protein
MSCRKICRELVAQARFGELGPGSAPHLEHLIDCRSCRDELGFDRALVRQLRTALAERIEGAAPSPRAWEGILERMAIPEPRPSRLRAWSTVLVARLRVGSAMAGASLAILVALNVEVVPVRPSDAVTSPLPATAPSRPLTLADGFPQTTATMPYAGEPLLAEEPVVSPPAVIGIGIQEPERLPILRARADAASSSQPSSDARDAADEPVAVGTVDRQPLTVRLVPSDAAVVRASTPASAPEVAPSDAPMPEPAPPSGAPS